MSLLPLKNPAACPAPPAARDGTAQSAVTGDWWAFAKEVTCSTGNSEGGGVHTQGRERSVALVSLNLASKNWSCARCYCTGIYIYSFVTGPLLPGLFVSVVRFHREAFFRSAASMGSRDWAVYNASVRDSKNSRKRFESIPLHSVEPLLKTFTR